MAVASGVEIGKQAFDVSFRAGRDGRKQLAGVDVWFDGAHFFIQSHEAAVVRCIERELTKLSRRHR